MKSTARLLIWPIAVDLAYIGRALQRLTTEVASLRDDMRVLTAVVLRHETMLIRLDETLNGILEQMRAMVAQNAPIVNRLVWSRIV